MDLHGLNAGNYPACSRSGDTSGWPRTLESSATKKRAKGDPVPTFLQFFYNNEVGKEAPEARAGSLVPTFLQKRYNNEFGTRSRSGHTIVKNYERYGLVLLFMPKIDVHE